MGSALHCGISVAAAKPSELMSAGRESKRARVATGHPVSLPPAVVREASQETGEMNLAR
jgi:hypothetical protein